MTRHGSCKQCGKCCQILAFPVAEWDAATREFFDARGLTITDGMVEVPHVCPHYNAEGCDLHGEYKPIACKEFPFSPQGMVPGCGFSWTDD